jgi:organic radical activating enzyme
MKPIRIFNEHNRFVVDWTLHNLCTYKCSYCPPFLNRGENVIYEKEQDPIIVRNFLENLKKYLGKRSVHIFLNGGEPTISNCFETIVDFCDEVGWCAYVSTNASRSLDWWKRYAPKIFKISVSYHPEFADEEIFNKIKEIGKLTNVGVFTLMYPPYWSKSVDAFNRFKEFPNITLEPSRVFRREHADMFDISYDYSREQLEWLEKHSGLGIRAKEMVIHASQDNLFGETRVEFDTGESERLDEVEWTNLRKNKFKGWLCNMGIDHIAIRGNGEILHSACKQAKVFTTIKDFSGLETNPTLCETSYCMCTADVMIPKLKVID